METRYLKEFVTLAEKCNYADASEALFISQSSLFKHMKSIEHELDIVLFDKSGNRIVLSEEGKIFLKHAQISLTQEDNFKAEIARFRKKHNQVINIGFEYRILNLLIAFRMQNSQFVVRQMEHDPHKNTAINLLRAGKCELAFVVNFDNRNDEFVQIPVLEDQDVAVLYDSHPLARHESLTYRDVAEEDFIVLGDEEVMNGDRIATGDLVRPLFYENGGAPNVVFNANRGSEILEYVRKEMGISILYKKSLSSMNLTNISMVDIEPAHPIYVSLCYPKNTPLSAGAKAFVKYIEDVVASGEIEEIIENKI